MLLYTETGGFNLDRRKRNDLTNILMVSVLKVLNVYLSFDTWIPWIPVEDKEFQCIMFEVL